MGKITAGGQSSNESESVGLAELATAVEYADLAVFHYRGATKTLKTTSACCSILGLDQAERITILMLKRLLSRRDRKSIHEAVRIIGGADRRLDVQFTIADSRGPQRIRVTGLAKIEDHSLVVAGTIKNVTLDARQDLRDLILEKIRCYVFLKNEKKQFIYACPYMCRAFRKTAAEMSSGKYTDYDLLPPDEADRFNDDDDRVLSGQELEIKEEKVTFISGDERYLATFKQLYVDPVDGSRRIFGVATDITALKTNTEKTNRFLAILIQLIQIVNSTHDTDQVMSDATSTLCTAGVHDCFWIGVGRHPESMRFSFRYEFCKSPEWVEMMLQLSRHSSVAGASSGILDRLLSIRQPTIIAASEAIPLWALEERQILLLNFSMPDGDSGLDRMVLGIDLTGSDLASTSVLAGPDFPADKDYSVIRWGEALVAVFQSCFARISFQGRLTQQQDRLATQAKLVYFKAAALASSHALATELTAHRVSTKRLLKDREVQKNLAMFEYLNKALKLLDYWKETSRQDVETFKAEDRYVPINVVSVIKEALDRASEKFRPVRVRFDFDTDRDSRDQKVVGSPRYLLEIFSVLLENAVEAHATVVFVRVSTSMLIETFRSRRYLFITVSDNGDGVAVKDQERIKKPGMSTKENGFGMGLAIADMFVALFGGGLNLESGGKSVGDEFTVFRVTLPCHD
jgi:signal transduction histidine kinase